MKYSMSFLIAAVALVSSSCSSQVPEFSGERAMAYLQAQCDFGPRNPGSKGHAACLDYLTAELEKYADTVVKQPFLFTDPRTGKSYTLHNIIASFGGGGERVLLCAHWDTRPVADFDPDPANRNTPIPGASDGASGTAALLEIARHLKENPPPRGVDIVLFDGEDSGLQGDDLTWCQGSRYFAQNRAPSYFPRYAVLLDMIGDADLQLPQEVNSLQAAPELMDKIWTIAENLGFDAFIRRPGHEMVDDHLELLKVGIPAVDIIDFDYEYWHTVEDTPDKCSPESLYTVGTVVMHLIYE